MGIFGRATEAGTDQCPYAAGFPTHSSLNGALQPPSHKPAWPPAERRAHTLYTCNAEARSRAGAASEPWCCGSGFRVGSSGDGLGVGSPVCVSPQAYF